MSHVREIEILKKICKEKSKSDAEAFILREWNDGKIVMYTKYVMLKWNESR